MGGLDFLRGRERAAACGIAAATVLICWAVILSTGDRIKSQDETSFLAIAQNLAFEGTYAEQSGTPTAYRAPGLVFFLAPLVRLGAGLVELRMANALLVGVGLVVLFHLVRRHAGPAAGLLAVALVPLWPVVIYAASTLYPQTLAALLLLVLVWFLDRLTESASLRPAALAGLASGLLVLTVPVVLLLMPVFLGWILSMSRRRLVHAGAFCAVSAVIVGAWTVRNYAVFDTFIPVATSSGYNLLAGNTPGARHDTSLDVRFPGHVYTEITDKPEAEVNRILTEAAIREIRRDPARAGALYLGKFAHWFDFSNALLSDKVVPGGASAISPGTREVLLFVTYSGVIALPLLVRIALCRRFPFRPLELLFLCLWIGAGLAYAIYFTRVRFRLPFDWLIIASNAMFLAAVAETRLARRKGAGAPAGDVPPRA